MAILIFWWMLLLWAVVIGGFFAYRYWRQKRRKQVPHSADIPVAHTIHLTTMPEYVAAIKKYRLLVYVTTGVLSLGLLTSIILTARPSLISNVDPIQKNRDIMLCLDASGSLLKTDTAIINRFSQLVSSFSGQRFGLTLFNSSAVPVIPLNDNYQLISQQLGEAGQAFSMQSGVTFTRLTNGTLAGFEGGTSLASDGLASCVQYLGNNNQGRSQTIILATDNEVFGTPITGMVQSVGLARERNVRVFVIDPGVSDPELAVNHKQLEIVAEQTGGAYFKLDESNTVGSLIDGIAKQTPEKFIGISQPAIKDSPNVLVILATLFTVASLVLFWRLEL